MASVGSVEPKAITPLFDDETLKFEVFKSITVFAVLSQGRDPQIHHPS